MSAEKSTQETTEPTQEIVENFIQWREDMGFDNTNPNWINSRNVLNMTPLQIAILMFDQGDARAPAILQSLLSLGADPAMNVPHNEGVEVAQQTETSGNAIAFAAARGRIDACFIMYKHNPGIVNAPTGQGDMLDAFAAAAFQIDNELPEDATARSFEVARKEACENLIRLFVKEMEYNVNTPLSTGDLPLECMVLNNRPIATKLLIELGGDIGAIKELNILQLAAASGADKVLPVIKDNCPNLFAIQKDISLQPLILAMSNSKDADVRYSDTIKFIAKEQYKNGMGIINILSIAVENNLLLARDALVDVWVTKFDTLAAKTPLMWAMEKKNFGLVAKISALLPETMDQMPEFGKGLLTLDDNSLNIHYPQFALDSNAPGGVRKVLELVPSVEGRHLSSDPTGVIGLQNHPQFGHSQIVHINSDKFNYACKNGEIELAQSISKNPNLGTFNDNTRQDHIHYAVRFANKETVDNIASKHFEAQAINNIDSFMRSPLDYAALRWVSAQRESEALEAKYIISTLCHHGANSDKVCNAITNQEFLDIFINSEATYASWHPADDVEVMATGISDIHLDKVA